MPAENPRFMITPDTKVGEMLERYPQLEEVLIAISPTYKALKNPVLRRTVARVATLRQVSKVGDVPLGQLIGRLRSAAGLEPAGGEVKEAAQDSGRPAWAVPTAVALTFDARPVIAGGGHPLPEVMGGLARLGPGQVYELLTPFVPAPLIDIAKGKGFVAFTVKEGPDLVRTFFAASPTQDGSTQPSVGG